MSYEDVYARTEQKLIDTDEVGLSIRERYTIAIIGLGYVGLPLLVAFSEKMQVIGYDKNPKRISELQNAIDRTNEIQHEKLASLSPNIFVNELETLKNANVFIVTVPTPITQTNQPDLSALRSACIMIGNIMKQGSIIVFESTVYPGATEEFCVPILEEYSGQKLNEDFFVGYSPERINPGDKTRSIKDIVKVTSGSTSKTADTIDAIYKLVIDAGTYKASSIKVAEAAKVIENTQRDLNIALINEFAIIFNRLNIDTTEVLSAASTKWNFLKFVPGLVGGHCIGVDPYYLTYRAQIAGYYPEIILAGRRINDGMANFVCTSLIKQMIKRDISIKGAKILICGFTFKENCPDVRNTKVNDIVTELMNYGSYVEIYDTWCDYQEVYDEYNLCILDNVVSNDYDAIILSVAHDQFRDLGIDWFVSKCKSDFIIYDLKSIMPYHKNILRL